MGTRGFILSGSVAGLAVLALGTGQPGCASKLGFASEGAATRGAAARAERVVLSGPELPHSEHAQRHARPPKGPGRYPLFVQARDFDAPVYLTKRARWGRGLIRYGSAVPARSAGSRKGCAGGHWYELAQGGFVCSARAFSALERYPKPPDDAEPPDLDALMPYRYARVITQGALRFERPLTQAAIASLLADWDSDQAPEGVVDRMVGDYFMALAEREEADDGTEYYRTVRGQYVLVSDLKPLSTPPMHGVTLESLELPVLFVYGEDPAAVYRRTDEQAASDAAARLKRIGIAEKHARAAVERRVEIGGKAYYRTPRGLLLPAERVRVARRHERPDGVDADERWVHVDVAEQTLVAYQGDTPVFATLISSGKAGHDTPPGSYRIRHKYVSITMRGDDPHDGPYEVEEVPWTLYYDSNFALHGAYWHDTFGLVRSHGCTNLAPADAHWLYNFTDPKVPAHWHGVREDGTQVLITG